MGVFRKENAVEVGSVAPDFALPAHSGETVRLGDFLGKKPVVLFFYPRDDTPGCTRQACAFRDRYESFSAIDAEVIGVSSDSIASHDNFAEKHGLPFTLLSDEGGKVRRLYGATSAFGLLPARATYVVDRAGVVRHIFSSQIGVERHVDEALAALRELGLRKET